MGLNYISLLTPSKAPFYGIVPGNSSTPIGSITLPVTFGIEQNFWTEHIKFEVADFESSYHAILGRPALAKFMAVPHYVYLRSASGILMKCVTLEEGNSSFRCRRPC